jgi:hypothetical protein
LNEITKQFIRDNLNADVPTLALKKAPVGTDVSLALHHIEARQLLKKKVPSWSDNEELVFPARRSIEQCSSEATAQYKASLLQGNTFADLTGGLGIDSYYLSQGFQQADYAEPQSELCDMARHNFSVLNANIKVWNQTAETFLNHCDRYDCLYLDPSRRDSYGRKTISIGDCTPDIGALQELLLQKADTVMVKLSPMLDISQALIVLRYVKDIHIVAVENECKELVFILQNGYVGQPTLHAVNLLTNQPVISFTLDMERDCPLRLAETLCTYLYEPNAALLKSGCFKLPTECYDVLKLHKNSHLYTSNTLIPDFPGRVFTVEGFAPYHKKACQALLSDLTQANLSARNFPLSVIELRKSLKITDGGDVFLFATTLKNGDKVLVRTKKTAF